MENMEKNSEMIWKLSKKSRLNCEMIWKIWKKGKFNSEKDRKNMEEKKAE